MKSTTWKEIKFKAIEDKIKEYEGKKKMTGEDKEKLERFKRLRDALRTVKDIKEKKQPKTIKDVKEKKGSKKKVKIKEE